MEAFMIKYDPQEIPKLCIFVVDLVKNRQLW